LPRGKERNLSAGTHPIKTGDVFLNREEEKGGPKRITRGNREGCLKGGSLPRREETPHPLFQRKGSKVREIIFKSEKLTVKKSRLFLCGGEGVETEADLFPIGLYQWGEKTNSRDTANPRTAEPQGGGTPKVVCTKMLRQKAKLKEEGRQKRKENWG